MRDVNYDDDEISEVTSLKPTTTTNSVDEEGRVIYLSTFSDHMGKPFQHIIFQWNDRCDGTNGHWKRRMV